MFWVVVACALLAACGGAPQPAESKKETAPAAAPPVDTANAGRISGKVLFAGAKPAPKTISMDATPQCAKMHSGPIYAEDVIVNANGTLKNAFVWIKDGLPKREYPAPAAARIDQKGCIYTPRVLGLMVGQTLEISNSDDTNHNIHPMPRLNREWNESQPPKGELKVKTFPKEEMPPILFKCNVHPWMRAFVGVVSHPFFAVTGDDGTFSLANVPPGEYTLEAWHERYGTQELKVKVEAKQEQTSDFTFKAQ